MKEEAFMKSLIKKNTIENEGSQQSGMCKTRGRVKYKPPINRIIIYRRLYCKIVYSYCLNIT